MKIEKIFINEKLLKYIDERDLSTQFNKAKNLILSGYFTSVNFKQRQPKKDMVYSFRINKQFRAFGLIKDNCFYVVKINNHQN